MVHNQIDATEVPRDKKKSISTFKLKKKNKQKKPHLIWTYGINLRVLCDHKLCCHEEIMS